MSSASSEMTEKFKEFHRKNPNVYKRLVALTKEAHDKGKTRVGLRMLFEVVRWNEFLETTDSDFKINNNYAPYYARMIMHQHPEFGDIFETRVMRSGDDAEGYTMPNFVPHPLDNLPRVVFDKETNTARLIEEG